MPHVQFDKKEFLEAIDEPGYSDEKIIDLFASLGMEAEIITSETESPQIELEFMANRYDLSGMEGVVMEVRCFLGKSKPLILTPHPAKIKFYVEDSTRSIRPFAIGAVLRGMQFTPERFQHFIDLQEKLHDNACRKRSLVAVGTHDMSNIVPPFYYRGEEYTFKFRPLKSTLTGPPPNDIYPDPDVREAREWFDYYEKKKLPLGKYIHLIRKSTIVPVIRDSNGVLLSLPPIVNGEHTKCTLETKDIFFDVTGTDLTRMIAVMNVLLSSFAQYCSGGIESVEVISSHPSYSDIFAPPPSLSTPLTNKKSYIFPRINPTNIPLSLSYINSILGINLSASEAIKLLERRQILAEIDNLSTSTSPSSSVEQKGKDIIIRTTIPSHRSDILHQSDMAEDILIAYGLNRISASDAPTGVCPTGKPLLSEETIEIVRQTVAFSGYVEVYNFVLLPLLDNTKHLRRNACKCHVNIKSFKYNYPQPLSVSSKNEYEIMDKQNNTSSSSMISEEEIKGCKCGVITTLNGKTEETESARTSLLPCLLLSLRNNSYHQKPICLFEAGDVVLPDVFGCGGSLSGIKQRNDDGLIDLFQVPSSSSSSSSSLVTLANKTESRIRCEGICGGGCFAYGLRRLLSQPLLPPNAPWNVQSLFEKPSLNGTIPSDTGARNERRICAVRCGSEVTAEELIPLLNHLFSLFRCVFVDDASDPVSLIHKIKKNMEKQKELKKEIEKEENKGKLTEEEEELFKIKFIPAIWQMIPISKLLERLGGEEIDTDKIPSSLPPQNKLGSSSLLRWLEDSYSFVKGNVSVICLTDLGRDNEEGFIPLIQHPIGIMGVLRPDVLFDFHIPSIVVGTEINIEPLMQRML